ncbi:uncharacterized protein LOC110037820, partial [Phalaenopsis equestris]|uniref:uncharacterized protein LOC110037820 n=1 Tax=Phalaenopsis equestris TaxID=78828 RepID=UPI0009E21370
MEVARSSRGTCLSKRKYVNLLTKTSLLLCKPVVILMDPNEKLADVSNVLLVNKTRYQRIIGKLTYVAHMSPNIFQTVGIVHRIIHYLKSIPCSGLLFLGHTSRYNVVYADVDWTGFFHDRRSTSG